MLRSVLTVVYECGAFDLASSWRILEYAVAIYSSSSLGTEGVTLRAAEMYALWQMKNKANEMGKKKWTLSSTIIF